jgi:hypothetical protein
MEMAHDDGNDDEMSIMMITKMTNSRIERDDRPVHFLLSSHIPEISSPG